MSFFLCSCDLHFGVLPTPTPTAVPPPAPILTVVWVQNGDLMAWHEGDSAASQIASSAVIQPYLAPDARHVAFTRGSQGNAISLWAVGIDGTGEQQIVAPDVLRSIRNGHPQIERVLWADDQTLYFNTLQQYDSGSANDDDLYRVTLGGSPQLILPPGAGGEFAISPDGQQIAVVRAGEFDNQKGEIDLLDPLGLHVRDLLTFTALSAPSEVSFYPPLTWSADSAFLRVPIPARDNDRVALWRVPVDDQQGGAQIFGYISAAPDGLPAWSASGEWMVYLRAGQGSVIDLMLADADGSTPQVYASGDIANRHWLPTGDQFAYTEDGAVWIGQRGEPPRKLIDPPVAGVIFAGGDAYVYATPDQLRSGHLSASASALIQSFSAAPRFDAKVAP